MERFGEQSFAERVADGLTTRFGTFTFLVVNMVFFVAWIVVNLGVIPSVPAFDPYPFNLLTTFVSLEAIALSVIVLMTQNRAARIDRLREEVDFRIDIQSEQEVTKILKMLDQISRELHIPQRQDRELNQMKQKLNVERIAEAVRKELGN